MTDISADPTTKVHSAPFEGPSPRRTRSRLLRAWIIGLVVFGYGPSFTYGRLAWLFNEAQWRCTYFLYVSLVPLVGGAGVLLLPLWWYRPIHRALMAWSRGAPVDRQQCAEVYERTLKLPWRIALSAFSAAFLGYVIGMSVLHWKTNQPWIEIVKTFPAIPLVGGMVGAYCYFGTVRALHPVAAWCSTQLRYVRPVRRVGLAEKFLTTTCVITIAILCLLEPAAYTLGQVVTEQHLSERALERLRAATVDVAGAAQPDDGPLLHTHAALGRRGYVFTTDAAGRITSPHPRGYLRVDQEHLYRLDHHLIGSEGVWVDRVGQHRVVAFVRRGQPPRTFLSVAFPAEFSTPLHRFMIFSWIVLLEVLFAVFLFGRYYTRGITIPLAELTHAAQQIADREDLSQHVPITTNDELSEVANAFNRMVEQLRTSKADLEERTRRLERSTQELSALNQEMEDLLRVVSHDLRAPLINIQGFSKRLEPIVRETVTTLDRLAQERAENGMRRQVEALKENVQVRFAESLRFISKGVEKMDALLSSLLAVSRVGRKADPIQPNNLNEILDDVLATFDHQINDHAIHIIRHPLPTRAPCRRNEINQVFSNLIANAINYMGPTGNRFIEIGGLEREGQVECFVRDTGVGIAPEDQERIFQMFTRLQTVDVPGEGVGLAYVKKVLRSHGGRMWVVSQRGQGSTFFFVLPTTQPQQAAARG